jgi:hypothetical protein
MRGYGFLLLLIPLTALFLDACSEPEPLHVRSLYDHLVVHKEMVVHYNEHRYQVWTADGGSFYVTEETWKVLRLGDYWPPLKEGFDYPAPPPETKVNDLDMVTAKVEEVYNNGILFGTIMGLMSGFGFGAMFMALIQRKRDLNELMHNKFEQEQKERR